MVRLQASPLKQANGTPRHLPVSVDQSMREPAAVSIILNTGAGGGHEPQSCRELEQRLFARGLPAHVMAVSDGAQILQAANAAVQAGSRVVVAAGGDGTVSAVASRL